MITARTDRHECWNSDCWDKLKFFIHRSGLWWFWGNSWLVDGSSWSILETFACFDYWFFLCFWILTCFCPSWDQREKITWNARWCNENSWEINYIMQSLTFLINDFYQYHYEFFAQFNVDITCTVSKISVRIFSLNQIFTSRVLRPYTSHFKLLVATETPLAYTLSIFVINAPRK